MEAKRLYEHRPHPHKPCNVNKAHAAERLSLNDRIAVFISRNVGSMLCAYLFAAIGAASLVGAITGNTLLALTFGALSSYFLQLVLLPIILVGQNVQARHSELVAEEQYKTTLKTYHELEQLAAHLEAQDMVIARLAREIEAR